MIVVIGRVDLSTAIIFGDSHVHNAGDTAWMVITTALVCFMMPGLALFCGGLVGEKNLTSTMAPLFIAIRLVSVLWIGETAYLVPWETIVPPSIRTEAERSAADLART